MGVSNTDVCVPNTRMGVSNTDARGDRLATCGGSAGIGTRWSHWLGIGAMGLVDKSIGGERLATYVGSGRGSQPMEVLRDENEVSAAEAQLLKVNFLGAN